MKLHHILLAGVLFGGSWAIAQSGKPAQVSTSSSASGSVTASFPIPSGSTSCTWKAKDSDVFSDDTLFKSGKITLDEGAEVFICTFEYWCVDGEVRGPHGGSGEGTAEVYIEIQFNYQNGTQKSETYKVTCP